MYLTIFVLQINPRFDLKYKYLVRLKIFEKIKIAELISVRVREIH